MATRTLKVGSDFNATEKNPISLHTWDIWKEENEIVCLSHSGAAKRRITKFPFKEGTLGFFNSTSTAYCYFRAKNFQEFLEKWGIQKVSKEDPNRRYTLRFAHYAGGESSAKLYTDGEKKRVETDWGRTKPWSEDYPGTSSWEYTETVSVSGATFVLLKQKINERDNRSFGCTLYTEKDVISLEKELSKLQEKIV